MDSYIKLAESALSIDNFNFENLQDVIKLIDTKTYIKSSKYSDLIWTNYQRDNQEENHPNFADGSCINEKAVVSAKTYWIIQKDGKKIYLICKCIKNYDYICHGHSGGVDTAEMALKEIILQECYTNCIIKSDQISPNIMKIIFTLTDYITKSEYDEQDINVESILSSQGQELENYDDVFIKNIMNTIQDI